MRSNQGPVPAARATVQGPQRFADLMGLWDLTRKIDDRRAQQQIDVTGQAEITSATEGGFYRETARMRLPGQTPLEATRTYRLQECGAEVLFFFEDGRPFHSLALGQAHVMCHHDCPPDTYDVTYDFADWPLWRATWTVSGPRKDYVMSTTYMRRGWESLLSPRVP